VLPPLLPDTANRNAAAESKRFEMEMTDAAAVSRARTGDADAFRFLVQRHSKVVFRVAYRMTANEHDADDVVQETFLRAYRQLEHFEERANFSTWLHRIAINCSLDLLRSRGRHDKQYGGDPGEPELGLASDAPQPDRLLLSSELQQHVAKAMERLTGAERTAFMLRHFEGMPVEEIGRTLGIQVNAAKHTIFRAVKKLRESLEPLVRSTPCNT
jgi:RNA polymerase sigma-70 factor (ECF subfamily)